MKEISANLHLLSTEVTKVTDNDVSENEVLEQGTE
jgi:hypothetical protein